MCQHTPTPSSSLHLNTAGRFPALPDPMVSLRRTTMPTAPKGAPDLTFVDAFAGGGLLTSGLVAGAVAAGYNPHHLAYAEHDDAAAAVYEANFGPVPRVRDVLKVTTGALGKPLRHAERRFHAEVTARSGRDSDAVDLVIGGPPCQDFSRAHYGKRKAADPEAQPKKKGHGRKVLYLRMVRLIEVLMPKVAIIENVAAARHDASGIVQRALDHLDRIGYRVTDTKLDAMDYGVAQHRARSIVVAVRGDVSPVGFDFGAFRDVFGTRRHGIHEAICDLTHIPGDREHAGGDTEGIMQERIQWLIANPGEKLPGWLLPTCHQHKIRGQAYRRMDPKKPAPTLTRYFGQMANGCFTHPTEARTMSPREGLRAQGVSDWYRLPEGIARTHLYRIIANGAPAPLGERIVLAAVAQGLLHCTAAKGAA